MILNILTIVARDPANQSPQDHDDQGNGPVPQGAERDTAIQDVVTRLRMRANKATHRLMRAGRIEGLFKILKDHARGKDLIQIIGHGRIGELWLGATWTGCPSDHRGTYLLDSAPTTYILLEDGNESHTTVRLLGCTVGAPTGGLSGSVADGGTLVFDLARMWRCQVAAAVDPINADHFDATTGLFMRPDRLTTSDGTRVDEATGPAPIIVPTGEPEAFNFTLQGVSPQIYKALASARWQRVPIRSVLAAPDVVAKVRVKGELWRGELIANGRLLRLMKLDSPVREEGDYFAPVEPLQLNERRRGSPARLLSQALYK